MKNIYLSILISLFSFFSSGFLFSMDDGGMVMIKSPKDMATVGTEKKFMIEYEAKSGKTGDHLHLMVDGKREAVIRQLKGSAEVGPMKAGKHHICLVVNTKAHMPTGAEGCINVTAK